MTGIPRQNDDVRFWVQTSRSRDRSCAGLWCGPALRAEGFDRMHLDFHLWIVHSPASNRPREKGCVFVIIAICCILAWVAVGNARIDDCDRDLASKGGDLFFIHRHLEAQFRPLFPVLMVVDLWLCCRTLSLRDRRSS